MVLQVQGSMSSLTLNNPQPPVMRLLHMASCFSDLQQASLHCVACAAAAAPLQPTLITSCMVASLPGDV